MSIPQEFLGTIPGWITSAGVLGMLGLLLRYKLGWKRLTIQDETNIRDHYAKEVASLREKLSNQENYFKSLEAHWRTLMENSDRRHEECEEARRSLRNELEELHKERRDDREEMSRMQAEIDGLKRKISDQSVDKLLILEERGRPSEVAPESYKAAQRRKDGQ